MIKNRSDLLMAMREDLDRRSAEGSPGESFVESYPKKQAEAFARELSKKQDILNSYFSSGKYGAAVKGRKKDRYTVLKALEYSYNKGMIDAKEFTEDLNILVRDDSKCGVNIKRKTAAIVKSRNKVQTAAALSRDIVPVLLQIYLKEKKDDFRRNIGFHVSDRSDSKEDSKKKVYGDDISMLRDFEEYQQKFSDKRQQNEHIESTGVRKENSEEERLPFWGKMYELLRKHPDTEGIVIPLIVDEYCGTGIYILGRKKLLYSKAEAYKNKYPEWYRNNNWFIRSDDLCFICVFRFERPIESLTCPQKPELLNVDVFSDDDDECIFTAMRYGVDVCVDITDAYERYEQYHTENNYYGNTFLCKMPDSDDEGINRFLMRFIENDAQVTDDEEALMKRYNEEEQKQKEKEEVRKGRRKSL